MQGLLFVLLAPLAGVDLLGIDWPLLLSALALACFGLCAIGFAVAWWLDSTAGYHVVMSLLLLPLWILSGAMFPAPVLGCDGLAAAARSDELRGRGRAPRALRRRHAERHGRRRQQHR